MIYYTVAMTYYWYNLQLKKRANAEQKVCKSAWMLRSLIHCWSMSPLISFENIKFCGFIRGYKMRTLTQNGLIFVEANWFQRLMTRKAKKIQRRIQNIVKYLRWNIFAEIVNSWKLLTILTKSSVLDNWKGSGYTSVICQTFPVIFTRNPGNIYLLVQTQL